MTLQPLHGAGSLESRTISVHDDAGPHSMRPLFYVPALQLIRASGHRGPHPLHGIAQDDAARRHGDAHVSDTGGAEVGPATQGNATVLDRNRQLRAELLPGDLSEILYVAPEGSYPASIDYRDLVLADG